MRREFRPEPINAHFRQVVRARSVLSAHTCTIFEWTNAFVRALNMVMVSRPAGSLPLATSARIAAPVAHDRRLSAPESLAGEPRASHVVECSLQLELARREIRRTHKCGQRKTGSL